MSESDVIYIQEAAQILGKTETALRAMIQYSEKHSKPANLPTWFRVGRKFAFSRSAVKAWIKAQAKGGQQ